MNNKIRMLDLFSGIGGFALAASWVWADRLELVGFCEIDPYCQQVLANRWPKVPIFEDIKQLSADQFQDIDLITGGFPCQDISVAGQGRGLEGERSGLWFEMLRLISRIRPRYALIENVPMLVHRGLGRVLCDLTQVGYDAEWQVISAADVGAPHLRKRIWIVAYPRHLCGGNDVEGDVQLCSRQQAETPQRSASQFEVAGSGQESQVMAYPKDAGAREDYGGVRAGVGRISRRQGAVAEPKVTALKSGQESQIVADSAGFGSSGSGQFIDSCHQEKEGQGQAVEFIDERFGSLWSVEPSMGRVANGVPRRVDRLKSLGNSIVPQCAALIMNQIRRNDEF